MENHWGWIRAIAASGMSSNSSVNAEVDDGGVSDNQVTAGTVK
jgi:hypothetical protein